MSKYIDVFNLEVEVGYSDECYVLVGGNSYSDQNLETLDEARSALAESDKLEVNAGCKLQIVKCVLSCEVIE
jgi:hypothetical protein